MKKGILIISCIATCLSLKAQDQTINGDLEITGNLGIGVNDSGRKLRVDMGLAEFRTYDYGTEITVNTQGGWARSYLVRNLAQTQNVAFGGHNGTAFISTGFDIATDATGYRNQKLTIKSSGNIGIGTENPSTKLEISSNKTKFITLQRDGVVKKGHIGYGAAQDGSIYLGTDDNTYSLYVQQDGRIGMGTISPTTKLEISSDKTKFITLHRDGVVKKGHIGYGAGNGGSIYLGTEDTPYGIYLQQNGKVGIGTYNPDEKLSVNGKIHTKEVKVDLNGWSDFVFDKAYDLPTLEEVENHINTNGHLLDVPSEKDVLENGILLGEMNATLLQKIEELTLYTIEQDKQLTQQQEEIALLQDQNKVIKEQAKDIKELKALVNQLLKE